MNDFLAAGTAGMIGRVLSHPLDTCKTVVMTTSETPSSNIFVVMSSIVKTDGIQGLYRGVGIAAIGSAPAVALYLSAYDACKSILLSQSITFAPIVHLFSGFVAEAISCVFWVPIDVIKERLQSQPASVANRYRGSMDGLMTCFSHEGIRGLYKGYLTTLASFGPFSAVYFAAYEQSLRWIAGDAKPQFHQTMAASFLGNTVACVATHSVEIVKTRKQVQGAVLYDANRMDTIIDTRVTGDYSTLARGLRTIIATEGTRGLFRGLSSRIIYSAPNAALTMSLFEMIKGWSHPAHT